MREIKFRVWDGVNNKMIPASDTPWIMAGINDKEVPLFTMAFLDGEKKKLIPQQFTGLKDKYEREIYEGDIIKIHTYEDWFDNTGIGVVQEIKWSDKEAAWRGFTAKMSPKYHAGNTIPSAEQVEILGNVFENPELLS